MNLGKLDVTTCGLDAACTATLSKLKQNGWDKAETPYLTVKSIVSEGELSHLLRHGAISIVVNGVSTYHSVLANYAAAKFGPETNQIGFRLNFDLV
ncbi:hypothetical protein ACIPLR_17650 [Herbaspirillum huttiense]|uniref:hypothetical protein n=1 Tax=Herbaspirillum huttiense TaxID=863372 RepID=UPI0037FB8072